MSYTPDPSSAIPPDPPLPPSGQSSDTDDAGSEALGRPSLTFDGNSDCVRLTPLLSWNYFSLLSASAFWYERPIQGRTDVGDTGQLKKGNNFTVVSIPVAPEVTANTVGEPSAVTPVNGAKDTSPSTKNQVMYKVAGVGRVRNYANSWVDQQSATTDNHRNNWFIPTNLENAWREVSTSEVASLSNTDAIPNILIRSNYDFFKCGQDPNLVTDQTTKYADQDTNLAAEYILTSSFTLPENVSFAITFKVYSMSTASGQSTDPKGKGYFRVYWSKYCFQFNGSDASFCPDVTTGNADGWVFHQVSGLKLIPHNAHELITLVFEVIGNHIVISNAIDVGDLDPDNKRPSWGYQDLPEYDPNTFGLTVPATNLTIGVRALDIGFSYIPVVYPPKGSLAVANLETGYSIANLRVNNVVDTHAVMGGQTQVTPTVSDAATGTFGYVIALQREATVDKTPALRSFELAADPSSTGIGVAAFPITDRIRSLSLRLGLDSQAGTVSLDNRDGLLSSVGGIIPCQISTGWASEGGGSNVQPIFNGFINTQGTGKSNVQSQVTFSLQGADQVLHDAIALNLPIYDGWDSGQAVADLLTRGGWFAQTNVQQGGYQLGVGALGNPSFKFPLGQSILACIRDIGRIAGYWAFVDCLGVFNYIIQNASYGDFLGTFKEIPSTVGSYDEWLSLSGVKDTTDTRNAVLVVGVMTVLNGLPLPIAAVRTDAGGTVGNYLSDTVIPWLRWSIFQDPKINTPEAASKVAEQLWQNNNRVRLTTSGQVWGSPTLLPWKKIAIQLFTDDIGIPPNAQWRIINAIHSISADDRSNYTVGLDCEYCDPRFSFASWFE